MYIESNLNMKHNFIEATICKNDKKCWLKLKSMVLETIPESKKWNGKKYDIKEINILEEKLKEWYPKLEEEIASVNMNTKYNFILSLVDKEL